MSCSDLRRSSCERQACKRRIRDRNSFGRPYPGNVDPVKWELDDDGEGDPLRGPPVDNSDGTDAEALTVELIFRGKPSRGDALGVVEVTVAGGKYVCDTLGLEVMGIDGDASMRSPGR
jgi:hypothetical protein